MINQIALALILLFLALFLLSAFAPMRSQNKFWVAIHKIRAGMDFFSYWFINVCIIIVVICGIWRLLLG